MKQALASVLMVLFMCVGAWCTTVTSTTKIIGIDGQPFNGTLTLQLPFAGVNSQTNQLILSTPYTVSISNGSFAPFVVPGNDIMSPAMPYAALYADSFGSPVTRQFYYISSITFDVGSAPATPNFLNSAVAFGNTVALSGNLSIGGGNPWFDVTAPPFLAKCDSVTDDTAAIGAAVTAARLMGADIRLPNGKICIVSTNSSPAINLDQAINISLLCGTGAGRSRPGGGTTFTCGIHFTGSPAIGVGARGSFGVAINGVTLIADNAFTGNVIDTSHFPGDTRCGGNPCDTENFNLSNSTISASVLCTNGVSLDKTIISNVTNNHFFGCINQLKGTSGVGSYSNVIKVIDNDFNGSLGVLCYINNISEAWDVERNTFEVNNSVASTICNSGGNADAKGFTFKSNWDGDDASTGIATKMVLPAGLRGAHISDNTISNVHAATNLFNIGNNSKGVVISGNTYYVGSSYNVLYTIGTGVELDIGTNDYQGVTFTTFLSGAPVGGMITSSSGNKHTFGSILANVPTNVAPLASVHVRHETANSTGLPTIFGASAIFDGATDVTGNGTAKVYGVIGTARTVNSVGTGEKAFAGWFKSSGFSSPSEEVGVHAEVTDAGTSSTIHEGVTNGVTKYRFDGDGSMYLTKLLISSNTPSIAAAGCGGAAASIPSNNGPSSFTVNVGTTPLSSCTITLPTATTAWNCFATDITTNSTSVFLQKQTTTGASSVVISNFNDVAALTSFTASDILQVSCFAR